MSELISNELHEAKQAINHNINKAQESFVAIGYYLSKIKEKALYKEEGFDDLRSYAKAEFDLSETSTSRFVSVYQEFGIEGKPELQDKYKGFGQSKLSEMLQIPEIYREEIPENITREDLRETKKILKETEPIAPAQLSNETTVNTSDAATFDKDENLLKTATYNLFKKDKFALKFDKIYQLMCRTDLSSKEAEYQLMMIITDNGYSVEKVAGLVCFFKEDAIVITSRNQQEKITYDYGNLEDMLIRMFLNEGSSAKECWEAVYQTDYPEPPKQTVAQPKEKSTQPIKENTKEETKQIKTTAKITTTNTNTSEEPLPRQSEVKDFTDEIPTPQVPVSKENIEESPCKHSEHKCLVADADSCERENSNDCLYLGSSLKKKEFKPASQIEKVECEIINESKETCLCCSGEGVIDSINRNKICLLKNLLIIKDEWNEPIQEIRVNYCPWCGKKVTE